MKSSYYDEVYRTSPYYRGPPEKSPYYQLWSYILDNCLEQGWRILDIGCGPGQFAELCLKKGHAYIGVDYSEEALTLARGRTDATFHLIDVEVDQSIIRQGNYDAVTFIEFLEHVHRDLLVLESVPLGKNVVLSVPSFKDKAHVRHFPSPTDAIDRYKPLIELRNLKVLPDIWNKACSRYVISGVRRRSTS